MKLNLIKATALAAVAMFAAPVVAEAADLRPPVYKGIPRPMIPIYSWTGLYVGGTVGYGTGGSVWDYSAFALTDGDVKPKGMVYGITAGYNWQAGSFVYGLEGDYNFSNIKGTADCVVAGVTCETSNTWFATFRGRIGYAFDRFMPYVTGGGAYGNIKVNQMVGGVSVFDDSQTNWGWTVGAGVEYAFLGNWTAKVEYLYLDLGNFDIAAAPPAIPVDFHQHIFRFGLNYKFSGGL